SSCRGLCKFMAGNHGAGSPAADYSSETVTRPVSRLEDLSRWLGSAAAALRAHHRGGSKKVSKVLGADPTWFIVHDAYRTWVTLGLEPKGAENGDFEIFVEHLRHGVYGRYRGSPRAIIRNYIDARDKYVQAAVTLKGLMSDELGFRPVDVARTFERIIYGKALDTLIAEVAGFEEAKEQFLDFRNRTDLGV
uniref:hypothetical protein n=1 Tax=Henriciella sp. TaxID=1968823 RepID=UPI00260B1D06